MVFVLTLFLFVSCCCGSPCSSWSCVGFNASSSCSGLNQTVGACFPPLCFRCLNGNTSQVGFCGDACLQSAVTTWSNLVLGTCGFFVLQGCVVVGCGCWLWVVGCGLLVVVVGCGCVCVCVPCFFGCCCFYLSFF